jgi:quinoprotein glucose dehydrogenase
VSGRFFQPGTRLPCNEPPWGELVAINVDTGEIAWKSILGISDDLPEGLQRTGRPSIGGAITTAGGLVFVGATDDSRFRAFDAASGEMLWETKLDASAQATPITYLGKDGRQYVVVTATGGTFLRSPVTDDAIIAWALPADGQAAD